MITANYQPKFGPMARRTFLATASLGIVAGLSNHSRGRTKSKSTNDVWESLSELVSRDLRKSRADLYIRAANSLQSAEMGDAQSALYSFARDSRSELSFDGNFALVALCRMLFTKKAALVEGMETEFRRARIGAPGFLGETNDDDWLLDPIEIVDGVPFVIVDGYMLAGQAEAACKYVEYCIDSCDWNSYKFRPQSRTLKQAALKKLLASPKWKQELSKRDKEFLSAQIQ